MVNEIPPSKITSSVSPPSSPTVTAHTAHPVLLTLFALFVGDKHLDRIGEALGLCVFGE